MLRRFRDAISGRFITREAAEQAPDTTVSEDTGAPGLIWGRLELPPLQTASEVSTPYNVETLLSVIQFAADEMSNSADAIAPYPEGAEKALRSQAEQLQAIASGGVVPESMAMFMFLPRRAREEDGGR